MARQGMLVVPAGLRSVAGFEPLDEPGTAGCRWHLEEVCHQVSLIGGDWWSFEKDGVTNLMPREYLDTWEEASADLHALLRAWVDWTGPERLTVVPTEASTARVIDLEVMEAGYFGPVYRMPVDRRTLAERFERWMHYRYDRLLQLAPAGAGDDRKSSGPFWILETYVEQRILEEAFGPSTSTGTQRLDERIQRWAEATPLAAQKRQMRALFDAARTRPLTTEDFAFLEEKGEP